MNSENVAKWFQDKGDETLNIDYALTKDSVVYDVGGYNGNWAARIVNKYGSNVHIFEPIKKFYDVCVDRFYTNPRVTMCNYGLSDKTEEVNMVLSFDSSSVYSKGDATECVHFYDVAEIIKSPIDLININIEGGEYVLLARMLDTGVVKLCQNIQVQFHDTYPNCEKLRDKIRERLKETHTEIYCYDFVWESWKLNQGDNNG